MSHLQIEEKVSLKTIYCPRKTQTLVVLRFVKMLGFLAPSLKIKKSGSKNSPKSGLVLQKDENNSETIKDCLFHKTKQERVVIVAKGSAQFD